MQSCFKVESAMEVLPTMSDFALKRGTNIVESSPLEKATRDILVYEAPYKDLDSFYHLPISVGRNYRTLDFFIGNARIDGKFLVFETHEFITDKRGNANEKEVTKQANLMKVLGHRLFTVIITSDTEEGIERKTGRELRELYDDVLHIENTVDPKKSKREIRKGLKNIARKEEVEFSPFTETDMRNLFTKDRKSEIAEMQIAAEHAIWKNNHDFQANAY